MVVVERTWTPDSILEEPPLESRGVIIYPETKTTNKVIIIPPFTQEEIDRIDFARTNREYLDLKARDNNLACILYANSYLPWGPGLINRAKAIKQINCALKVVESTIKTRYKTPWNTQNYVTVFGIANYIRGALKPFEAK